jgi:hypothetical protein
LSGGNTRYLPLLLRLRAKTTTLSYQTPVYYVDLTLRDGAELAATIQQAKDAAESDADAGLLLDELEHTARALLQNGQFEDSEEEIPLVMEEFYPDSTDDTIPSSPASDKISPPLVQTRPSKLSSKLGTASR